MITKIKHIDNYGVFNDFDWDTSVRDKGNNVAEFKKINIIYGRNYSGKTTLSRIFRSFEKGEIHDKYPGATFAFEHSGQDSMCHLDVANCPYDIRVYNKDYIKEHLSFLIDEITGEVKSFAILGEANVALRKEIAEKELKLGSEEEKSGLKNELQIKNNAYKQKLNEKNSAQIYLDNKLRDKANNDIKPNPDYADVNYNITKIKADIQRIIKDLYSDGIYLTLTSSRVVVTLPF